MYTNKFCKENFDKIYGNFEVTEMSMKGYVIGKLQFFS